MHLIRAALTAFALSTVPVAAVADTVVVFAAASLRGALDDATDIWAMETGHDVVISYAGSSLLARQILAGAPADLFLSAAPEWMDHVQEAGLVANEDRVDVLGNRLVVIAHDAIDAQDTVPDLAALLGDGRLAMALVDAVPAGQYGKAALETLGQWEALRLRVAQSDNVRGALALVATGEAPLGIVYATDALAEPAVSTVARFPADSHPPITYPLALLDGASPAARALFDALQTDGARAVFARHGFIAP